MKTVEAGEFCRIRWTGTIVEALEGGSARVKVVRVDGARDPFDIGTCYLEQLAPGVHRAMWRTFADAMQAAARDMPGQGGSDQQHWRRRRRAPARRPTTGAAAID